MKSIFLVITICSYAITDVLSQNIAFYGTCTLGGKNAYPNSGISLGAGTLFKFFPANDSLAKVYDFDSINGAWPFGSLIQASDGKLYGLTEAGGSHDGGILFQFDPTNNLFTKKYDFIDTLGGGSQGGLVQIGNKLYGLTIGGGHYDEGVLYHGGTMFSYDVVTESYNDIHDFGGSNDGSYPNGSLTLLNDTLYGMTEYGGSNGFGTLFKYSLSDNFYSKVFDFDSTIYGQYPGVKLSVANNNKLYGMTALGGANGTGTIIEYDPANKSVSKKYDFNGLLLQTGNFVLANDSNLYGLTRDGGVSNLGELFQYNPGATSIVMKYSPVGSPIGGTGLMQSSNGLLYGSAISLFSYDYKLSKFSDVALFNDSTGVGPAGALLEITEPTGVDNIKTTGNLTIYPTPATDKISVSTNPNVQEGLTASVIDITGRKLISHFDILPDKIAFDIHSLSVGMYFVELKQGDSIYTGRFVKMN